jgi:phosphatidylserine/phosphatidylglycerophosphate/cardiolipin synthase-like enzyme
MSAVLVRAYASPTLVFLAFDWPDGPRYGDFLGFAIKRSPGHKKGVTSDFLSNKLGFGNPAKDKGPHPSNEAPIQKFQWWDAGIGSADRGKSFDYTVYPVRGTGPGQLKLIAADATTVRVRVPHEVDGSIGTYFNRAVVSSQSFARLVQSGRSFDDQMAWLANGLQNAVPDFLAGARDGVATAIYHLTDNRWIVPAFQHLQCAACLVYNLKPDDQADVPAANALSGGLCTLCPRTKTNIMHHKFIVRNEGKTPTAVLMGSANFTPEALTVQANLLHTFESKQLARWYAARQLLLQNDPTKAQTAKQAKWLSVTDIPGTKARVFFSPEPKGQRASIEAVVEAVKAAKKSVLFCMFSPTDPALLKAIMQAGDDKKMMYGLLNSIVDPAKAERNRVAKDPEKAMASPTPTQEIQTEVFHRSQEQRDIVSFAFFGAKGAKAPAGFLPELATLDTSRYSLLPASAGHGVPTVHIHHKFIVIDGETAEPTIYTGSANMSKNSVENNDENLLELKGNAKLAQIYVAEFFRLYDHYRARALWNRGSAKGTSTNKGHSGLRLRTKRDDWVREAYKQDSLDYIARVNLVSKLTPP